MSPILKIVAGALMMVLGIFTSITYSNQLTMLILGGIGPLLILIGAFIVWLESDELRVQNEDTTTTTETEQDFETQKTLNQQTQTEKTVESQQRQATQEIKQAVSSSTSTPDSEEILSGTVREVKEEVSDRDDLDIKELLEAEKQGQDRKTLVNYLERRVD
jgi:ABC-type bacteriocin/lantibiotic exporter with double-glycine peptidase domain